ncbi:hypothetical protein [Thermococcus sp. M36]|nr:hypothetical protein [Thermococcus sp. M36]
MITPESSQEISTPMTPKVYKVSIPEKYMERIELKGHFYTAQSVRGEKL